MILKHSHHLSSRFHTQFEESPIKETSNLKNSKHFKIVTSTSLFSKNRPYIYSKTIPKSLIDEGNRSKSILYHMNLLSNEARIKARPSRRERERTILFTDNMEIYHNKMIKRVKETNRRRSCCCDYCGILTKFEKKHEDFEVRTQQAICSDLKLLQFTRAGQKKKQTIIKEFKIKQINDKKLKSQQETTNSQIQINLPSTQRDSLQVEKIETERNRASVRSELLKLLPSVKNIVSLTILKQIYIAGRLQKHNVKKPSHDYLIMKTYNVK